MVTLGFRFRFARWAVLLLASAGSAWGASAPMPSPVPSSLSSGSAPARSLQALDYTQMEGERVVITLGLSAAAPEPVVFTIDKPPRLAIDLPDTRMDLTDRFRKIGAGKTRSVAVAESKGRTRVVVELTEPAQHSVRVDGNKVIVEIQGSGALASSKARAGTTTSSLTPAMPAVPARASNGELGGVDFRRGDKGEGRVIISLADPHTVVDVGEEAGKVYAKFRNASAPAGMLKRLDVTDFATPVKYIDVSKSGSDVNVLLTPVPGIDYDHVAYQTGSTFTVELQPLTPEKEEIKKKNEPQFNGERISLSFQNVDVRSLLQIIADVAGTNMVVSDSVGGDVAMRLQNVPWDQALDIILRTKGLGMRQQGNVMLVAPLAELQQREQAELQAEKAKVQLSPLRSEIIQINYAKASDIAALLTSSQGSLLSERGRVTVDDRTNTLLVQETQEKLSDVRSLVGRLDIPVRQVLIESRIVVANSDFTKSLGARFGVSGLTGSGSTSGHNLITTSGSAAATDTSVQSFLGGARNNVALGSLGDRFNVSLPASGAASKIAFAVLGADYLVDLELSALQSEGKGEVISSPRVVTANGKQASIEQGVEIPYQEASSSGASTVAFKKAVLSLNVTPQVTPDSRIIMDLTVNKDSVGQVVSNSAGGSIPSIDTRKVVTQVLVDNGQTVVLGGIYEQTTTKSVTKVPFLGDLPLLGAAFRNQNNVNNKAELLIFVTPKILAESLRNG